MKKSPLHPKLAQDVSSTYSVNKLADLSGMDRRTVKAYLKGEAPTGGTDTRPEWTLPQLQAAAERKAAENKGGSSLKEQKLSEEIRKLRHVNDSNAGLVVERAAVFAAFTRGKNKLAAFKVELETKWPAKLAGLPDVPAAREECRRIVDRIYEVFGSMAVEFEPLDKTEERQSA